MVLTYVYEASYMPCCYVRLHIPPLLGKFWASWAVMKQFWTGWQSQRFCRNWSYADCLIFFSIHYNIRISLSYRRKFPSIYQPTNAQIISHKTILKHFKSLRHVSILSDHHQGALPLLKLYYSIQNSNRICKRGVGAAYL